MSQKIPGDSAQKGFAVGRGLLAAAETLNFSMAESGSSSLYGSPSRPMGSMARGPGGGQGKDHDVQLSRRVGSHLSNTMKLFASLGLSPTDLDELAQIPEENISVETLPSLIMQLKNRKGDASRRMSGNSRDLSATSSDSSYRQGRDGWGDLQEGLMDHSVGQSTGRTPQGDYGFSSMQEMSSRGFEQIDYGHGGASEVSRERQYSELSRDSYRGLGMGSSSASDSMFMQRRMGIPSHGKVQDFLGAMPHMFPHVCSLCDFDVHSAKEWNQHSNGLRHSENCRLLLHIYPEWDPQMERGLAMHPLDGPNLSDGILGAGPRGLGPQRGGMSSNWGGDSGFGFSNKPSASPGTGKVRRGRVVVVKYDRKPISVHSILSLAKPFGVVHEHLVLKKKAFIEMETHEEALAVAEHYQRNPAIVSGQHVQIYLSKELAVIDKSQSQNPKDVMNSKDRPSRVVFFSNLPRDFEKSDLLTVARRFGVVEKYLFLNGEAFIQLETPDDAEMLVKYHTLNPLQIRGANIRLNICTKYKTLTVPARRPPPAKDTQNRSDGKEASSKTSRNQRSSVTSKGKGESSEKAETSSAVADSAEEQAGGLGEEVAGVIEGDVKEEEEEEGQAAEDEDGHGDGDVEMEELPIKTEEKPEGEEEAEPEEEREAEKTITEDQVDNTEPDTQEDSKEDKEDPSEEDKKLAQSEETTSTVEHCEQADETKDPESADGAQDDTVAEEPTEEQFDEPDFPENLDEFVTLDELPDEEDGDKLKSRSRGKDSSGSSRKNGGLRVVNVVGFRRGHDYLGEILALAKPFGKVVRHLVLNVRAEAFLELSNEQEARAMVSFYSSNVIPSVCGKPVKIYHSHTYATIQSGKVIYVGKIPYFKTSDASLLKIAEPFGSIRRYFLNRSRNECFIEMDNGEDAERMAEAYKNNPPKFQGKRLTVYMSRKYKQLKHGHRPPSPEPEEKRPAKRERPAPADGQTSSEAQGKSSIKKEEQPPAKKLKESEVAGNEQQAEEETQVAKTPGDQTEVEKEEGDGDIKPETTDDNKLTVGEESDKNGEVEPPSTGVPSGAVPKAEAATNETTEKKPELTVDTLGPHDPNNPVGVEFVKMGYYCRVCFLFYSNEETAKKVHCSSKGHYEKLKKHLEKEKPKASDSESKN